MKTGGGRGRDELSNKDLCGEMLCPGLRGVQDKWSLLGTHRSVPLYEGLSKKHRKLITQN